MLFSFIWGRSSAPSFIVRDLKGDPVLDKFRKSSRWLTAIFIFAIGIVFVFFLGLDGQVPGGGSGPGASDDTVASLDDELIRVSDFRRVREQQQQRMQTALGAQFDPDALASFLDSQTLQSLVNSLVLAQSAKEVGLVVSAEEVKDLLRNNPNLRDEDGRFDQATFDSNVRYTYGSQANYLSTMQRDLLQQKMFELLMTQSRVSGEEALRSAQYKAEEVQIAYVALDAGNLPENKRPSDEDVKAYFEANRKTLQAAYDIESSRFDSPEQVSLRHILFKATDGDATANRTRADEALARLQAGEDFAALAEELSDDTSSSENGGDLGAIGRGDVAPAIEAAAFDLPAGTNSEIIEGPDGLHIVLVDSKVKASKQVFDEAGLILAAEGASAEAATKLASDLSTSVAGGQSLEDAARAADLTLERTSFFTRRRDSFVPGLTLPSPEVIATAFTLTADAPSSSTVFDVGMQKVLIQLLERQEPDPSTLDAAVASARQSLDAQRQNEILEAWINDRRTEFESQGRLHVNAAVLVGS
jgi:peptidyl-prolyl cis-trans isomerase D